MANTKQQHFLKSKWCCNSKSDICCCCCKHRNYFQTTNNGVEWIYKNSGTTNNLNAVSFGDDQNGIAVGDKVICRTADAGENWKTSSFTDNFLTVSYREPFVGGSYIIIGSEAGMILYS